MPVTALQRHPSVWPLALSVSSYILTEIQYGGVAMYVYMYPAVPCALV